MSTSRPEPLAAGYTGPVGRRLLGIRRRCRRSRDRCRRLFRRRVGSARTFPFDPSDMRLAYGYRRMLLLAVVVVLAARLGLRLFALELAGPLLARDPHLLAFNVGFSLVCFCAVLASRRYWRWSRRASVRFAALVRAMHRSHRL